MGSILAAARALGLQHAVPLPAITLSISRRVKTTLPLQSFDVRFCTPLEHRRGLYRLRKKPDCGVILSIDSRVAAHDEQKFGATENSDLLIRRGLRADFRQSEAKDLQLFVCNVGMYSSWWFQQWLPVRAGLGFTHNLLVAEFDSLRFPVFLEDPIALNERLIRSRPGGSALDGLFEVFLR